MVRDLPLHLGGGIQGVISGRKGGHGLIAHCLDDRSLVLLGGGAHDFDARGDHVPGTQVAEQLIQPSRPHHVREQNNELDILAHEPSDATTAELYLTSPL